jgi:hypothetical protein
MVRIGPQRHRLKRIDIVEFCIVIVVESSRNVMAHGDAGRGSEGETGEWNG